MYSYILKKTAHGLKCLLIWEGSYGFEARNHRFVVLCSYGNQTFDQSWLAQVWIDITPQCMKLETWPSFVSFCSKPQMYVPVYSVRPDLKEKNRKRPLNRNKFETGLCTSYTTIRYRSHYIILISVGLLTLSTCNYTFWILPLSLLVGISFQSYFNTPVEQHWNKFLQNHRQPIDIIHYDIYWTSLAR